MKLRLPRKIKYLRKARHWRGHGIHSPFLFYLVTKVIEDKKQYSSYKLFREEKNEIRRRLKEKAALSEIKYNGQSIQNISGRKKLFKVVELGYRYGKLLFRLVQEFKPGTITFYGPTFGLNLIYLALADKNIPVNVTRADLTLSGLAVERLKEVGIHKLIFHDGEVESAIPQEFVFINLSFLPGEAQKAIDTKLSFCGEDDVMIIRGIHKSGRMEEIWKKLVKDKKARVTLDLYEIGIVLFRKKLQKEHFVLRF